MTNEYQTNQIIEMCIYFQINKEMFTFLKKHWKPTWYSILPFFYAIKFQSKQTRNRKSIKIPLSSHDFLQATKDKPFLVIGFGDWYPQIGGYDQQC